MLPFLPFGAIAYSKEFKPVSMTNLSERRFFRKGVENQKRPDITFIIKRPSDRVMAKWTDEQKAEAMKFMEECKENFKMHKHTIDNSIN